MKGNIFHALKSSEEDFDKFGEAYFTEITKDETKGWKKHTHMMMNLIVPLDGYCFIYGMMKTCRAII